jgi:hypothetical protein
MIQLTASTMALALQTLTGLSTLYLSTEVYLRAMTAMKTYL